MITVISLNSWFLKKSENFFDDSIDNSMVPRSKYL